MRPGSRRRSRTRTRRPATWRADEAAGRGGPRHRGDRRPRSRRRRQRWPRPRTRSGRLSELARHVVLPSGIDSTGWPAVRDSAPSSAIEFDEWQDGLGRAVLGKRADGIYAATVGGVVLSIPRQVAKTFIVSGSSSPSACCSRGCGCCGRRTTTGRSRTRSGRCRLRPPEEGRAAHRANGIRTANGEQEIRFRTGRSSCSAPGSRASAVASTRSTSRCSTRRRSSRRRRSRTWWPRRTRRGTRTGRCCSTWARRRGRRIRVRRSRSSGTKALSGKSGDMLYVEFCGPRRRSG
jgi:hypothetical protein